MRDVIAEISFESKENNVTMVKKDKFNTKSNLVRLLKIHRVRVSFNSIESKIEHFTDFKKLIYK